jgi:Kip1 ubiquitination-promoting complex protein 1
MDYHRILQLIFNINFSKDETKDFVNCLELVGKYLDEKLEKFPETVDTEREKGVIQPQGKIIVWDVDDDDISNLAKVSKDRLTLTSSTAFSTLKANACIYAGKFMYEVQLRSKGVMQVKEKDLQI